MLGKLFKHEMKATTRLLLPLYLILAAFTCIDRIVLSLDVFHGVFSLIPVLLTSGFVLSIIAVLIVSSVIIIIRFYKNMVTDEGYLMFTLPVKPSQLINAKLLVATIWTLASLVATIIAIFIVATARLSLSDLSDGFAVFIREFQTAFGSYRFLLVVELIILMLAALVNNILFIYLSIAIGQLFNGHKIIGSIVSYIAISTVLQIVSTILMVAAGYLFESYFETNTSIVQLVIPFSIIVTIILSFVYYFATDLLFRKKLNLE